MYNLIEETFTEKEKRAIIQEYLDLGPGMWRKFISRKYGIKGHSTFTRWLRRFVKDGQLIPEQPNKKQNIMKKQTKKVKEQPKPQVTKTFETEEDKDKRIKELEKALAHEQLRSLAFDRMIDIAEEQFKIKIRKKPGAKL